MKIVFIYRSKKQNLFSIENVFDAVFRVMKETRSVEKFYAPEPSTSIKSIIKNIKAACKIKGDILHITGDVNYLSLVFPGKKTVLTVHDLYYLKRRTGWRKFVIDTFWFRIPLFKARYITVVSKKTADELCSRFPKVEKKIRVIGCPVDSRYTYAPKTFNKEKPVLLQVGTRDNKNLERVAEAIQGIPCRLDIVGGLSQEQKDLLCQKKIDYRNSVQLSNEEIIEKYRQCDLVVFASVYEGFGMPVIEAQATGRAIITSKLSPMTEVAGDGAFFVDPYNVTSIREGILKAIEDDTLRQQIIENGRINVQKYTAEKIAEAYFEIYNMMV